MKWELLGITLLLLLSPWTSLGQQSSGGYQPGVYSLSDGLPQSQIFSLHEGPKGYMWIGTQGGGLAKFDGKEFSILSSANGLPGNRINQITSDSEDQLWIATNRGIAAYDGSEFKIDSLSENQNIRDFLIDQQDRFWVSDDEGVYYWDHHSDSLPRKNYILTDDVIHDLYESSMGEIYACGDLSFYQWQDTAFVVIPFNRYLYGNCIFEDNEKNIYCGTFGNGLLSVKDQLQTANLPFQSPSIINAGWVSQEGEWWLASNRGVQHIASKESRPYNYTFSDASVECLYPDSWGNIWCGTSGEGLARMSILPFLRVSENSNPSYAITPLRNGDFAFSNGTKGLSYFSEGSTESDSTVTSGKVKALLEGPYGTLWVGMDGQGIQLMRSDTSVWITGEQGLSSPFIRDFEKDSRGNIWVATAGGGINKIRYSPKQFIGTYPIDIITSGNGLSEDRITSLEADELDRIWYATRSSGIGVILPQGDILHFNRSNGLPSDEIRSIVIDDRNILWIGCAGGQIAYINLNEHAFKVRELKFEEDRPFVLYALLPDPSGDLWIGSANGVWRVTMNAQREVIGTKRFGIQDGVMGLEVCSNAMVLDADNRLWVGTMEGLVAVNNAEGSYIPQPPVAFVSDVRLNYRSLRNTRMASLLNSWGEPTDTLVFTHDQNNLSFDIAAVHPNYGNEVQFAHILDGLESSWSPLSAVPTVNYSNLPPGDYTLKCKACVRGNQCAETTSLQIQILRPYWQEKWFIITSIAVGILLIALIVWRLIYGVRKRARLRLERLEMERQILDVEQKALRLQMNPHFIFNTLNSIQGLIAKEDNKSARLYLSRFSHLMREILDNSLEDTITLEEEIEALKHYLELQQFTHEQCFTFEVELDASCAEALVPPLLLQPFAENSILHGIVPKGKGKITIAASKQDDLLQISLKDDGIGRKAASNNQRQGHRSAGLEVTRERLETLARSEGSTSKVEIVDLNEGSKATGTMVIISLPFIDEFG